MNKIKKNPLNLIVITAFFLAMIISLLIICFSLSTSIKERISESELLLDSMSSKLEYSVNSRLLNLRTLEVLVHHDSGMLCDFEEHATYIYDRDPAVRCIQLAPNGVITHIYPIEGNENAFGNLFVNSKRKAEALLAKDSGEMALGGPYELHQGGMGVVARRPIFINNDLGEKVFWGLAIEVLDLPILLDSAEIKELNEYGYSYRIWHYDAETGEPTVFAGEENLPDVPLTAEIKVPGGIWYMSLVPSAGWFTTHMFESGATIFIVVNALTLLLALTFMKLVQSRRRYEEISLTDDLTGLQNTRAFYNAVQELSNTKEPFFLFYLDLNKFKEINDTYGHAVGNNLLYSFAQRVRATTTTTTTTLYRIGGDEFVIISYGEDEGLALDYKNALMDCLTEPFVFDELVLNITASCGYANYPKDDTDIIKVMRLAENRMYEEKARSSQPIALYNRNAFFTTLRNLIEDKSNQDENLNFYFYHLDFKNFKLLNYRYGVEASNILMNYALSRINSLPECLLCSRGYADQLFFVTMEPNTLTQKEVSKKFWRYYKEFLGKAQAKIPDIIISCNIGISKIENMDIESAAGRANLGRVLSKRIISKEPVFIDQATAEKYMEDKYFESYVLYQVYSKNIWYELQPIVALDTGKAICMEALGRISDKDGNTIYPKDFLPILISTEAITDFDLTVLEHVCRDISLRLKAGRTVVPVNINLSPIDISTPNICEKIASIINKHKVSPKLINIEITENIVINDIEKIQSFCKKMHDLGIKVLMDDFGSGFMNFELLRKLPIDMLKIDKSILNESTEHSLDNNILNSILSISNELHIPMICEGVETAEQCTWLKENGMEYVQGFYFSKPAKPEITYDSFL